MIYIISALISLFITTSLLVTALYLKSYMVKRVGVKGIMFICKCLTHAIDTADRYKEFNM